MAFSDPAMAALIGWLVAMTSRQVGHLFFEPRGYDQINQATDEYKEEIKVGYNIKRKLVLLAVWAPRRCCWSSTRPCSASSRRTPTPSS